MPAAPAASKQVRAIDRFMRHLTVTRGSLANHELGVKKAPAEDPRFLFSER
jgi:hypothetical protein